MDNDVTFAAQLSFDRLQMIEELAKYWEGGIIKWPILPLLLLYVLFSGPISLTLYITDPELDQVNDYIDNSDLLQERTNIAYHAVFKDGVSWRKFANVKYCYGKKICRLFVQVCYKFSIIGRVTQ